MIKLWGYSGVVVANPAVDVLGFDFIFQPDPSGNFKPGQGNWQF